MTARDHEKPGNPPTGPYISTRVPRKQQLVPRRMDLFLFREDNLDAASQAFGLSRSTATVTNQRQASTYSPARGATRQSQPRAFYPGQDLDKMARPFPPGSARKPHTPGAIKGRPPLSHPGDHSAQSQRRLKEQISVDHFDPGTHTSIGPDPARFVPAERPRTEGKERQRIGHGEPRVESMTDSRGSRSDDGIVYLESNEKGGIPTIARVPEARKMNRHELSLNRLRLSVCPEIQGESYLSTLNLRHNFITKIERLERFYQLSCLDLHDNLITSMDGLEHVKTLHQLRLSSNRIKSISHLQNMKDLQILDLQQNSITKIDNLRQLRNLRVLLLSANQLSDVSGLDKMEKLKELHLRRNSIRYLTALDRLARLELLDVSYNCIENFDNIECVGRCQQLRVLALSNNPMTTVDHFDLMIIDRIQGLQQLDSQAITEVSRERASAHKDAQKTRRRDEQRAILQREQVKLCRIRAKEHWISHHEDKAPGGVRCGLRSASALDKKGLSDEFAISNYVHHKQGERELFCGCQSVARFCQESPPALAAGTSNLTLKFEFVCFDEIAAHLSQLASIFKNVCGLELQFNNVDSLLCINAIATAFPGLTFLYISSKGNPITQLPFWREYIIFRFASSHLRSLNGALITGEQRQSANHKFGLLGDMLRANISKHMGAEAEAGCMISHHAKLEDSREALTDTSRVSVSFDAGAEIVSSSESGVTTGDNAAGSVLCLAEGEEEIPVQAMSLLSCCPAFNAARYFDTPQEDISSLPGKHDSGTSDTAVVHSLIETTLQKHVLTEALERLWPAISDEVALTSLHKMRDLRAYEQCAMHKLTRKAE